MAKRNARGDSSPADESPVVKGPPAPGTGPDDSGVNRSVNILNTRKVILLSAFLFVLVVWVFLPALKGDFIEYDDTTYVTEHASVKAGLSLANLARALVSMDCCNWHPVAWWSHIVDCQLYGLEPWG